MVSRKPMNFFKINLGNQNKKKQMKFFHLFLHAIKNSLEVLKKNNVPGFKSIKLVKSKRHPPNFKKLLSKVEFNNEELASHCYCPTNIHTKM